MALLFTTQQQSSANQFTIGDHTIAQMQFVDGPALAVEIVSTPESITQGLSGRDQLGAEGMLFVFNQPGIYSFWMKQMRFDLDLIWIRSGKIVAITPNVPKPEDNTPDSALPSYESPQIVDMVLEVPAGFAQKSNLVVGSQFILGE